MSKTRSRGQMRISHNISFSGLCSKMLLVFLLCAFYSACSRTEPLIEYGFISLVYYQENNNKISERLSFFVIADDDDGIENLDELLLFHDYEQLHWRIGSADWMTLTHNEKTWIGSWSLALDNDESLPRGQYRAVLINKGGEKTQRNFSFDPPETNTYPFPSLEIADGNYKVTSLYPQNRLICYDAAGKFISTVTVNSKTGAVSSLNLPSNALSAALWAEDANYFTSALTEAVSLR